LAIHLGNNSDVLWLAILRVVEEEVDEGTRAAEWQNKPYNMEKHGQESSSWHRILYAGGIWGGSVFQLGMTA